MSKIFSKRFFRDNPPLEMSAARVGYELHKYPDLYEFMQQEFKESDPEKDALRAELALLSPEENPNELVRWMRRDLPGIVKQEIIQLVVDHEETMMPIVLKRLLTSSVDNFIENATSCLIKAKTNHSQWVLDHYDQIRDPYAQSSICLMLGFRADVDIVPWMMEQYEKMDRLDPDETFEQGPLLALWELRERFDQD